MQLMLHANSSKEAFIKLYIVCEEIRLLLLIKKYFCCNNSPYKVTAF